MRCGSEPKDRRKVNVDHIKPRKYFPELALCFDNLQVLCSRCNKEKGNKTATDYRSPIIMQKAIDL
jgi:5-methylcytosine-specific restriction endonuclease McrA